MCFLKMYQNIALVFFSGQKSKLNVIMDEEEKKKQYIFILIYGLPTSCISLEYIWTFYLKSTVESERQKRATRKIKVME